MIEELFQDSSGRSEDFEYCCSYLRQTELGFLVCISNDRTISKLNVANMQATVYEIPSEFSYFDVYKNGSLSNWVTVPYNKVFYLGDNLNGSDVYLYDFSA